MTTTPIAISDSELRVAKLRLAGAVADPYGAAAGAYVVASEPYGAAVAGVPAVVGIAATDPYGAATAAGGRWVCCVHVMPSHQRNPPPGLLGSGCQPGGAAFVVIWVTLRGRSG